MNISILISTYKRSDFLKETLSAFQELNTASLSWQVLVADNANDPETQKILKSFRNKLPLDYIVVTRPGKNAALNQLVTLAQGQLIVFTDDDVTPDKNWLIELWEAYNRWPDDFLFGGKVIPIFPPNTPNWVKDPRFEFANVAFAWFDEDGKEGPWEGCPYGPNMAVKSEVFLKYKIFFDENIGPYGSDYPMGSETSFCKKLKTILRSRFIYVPKSIVYHRIRPDQVTFKALLKRAYRYGRGFVASNPEHNCKEILGAPRYLYKKICILFLKYAINFWRPHSQKWYYGKLLYFHLGMLKQYRLESKKRINNKMY